MRRMGWVLLLALPWLVGCGTDDDDDDEPAAGGASGGNDTVLGVCDDQTTYALEDVSGKWAYLEVQSLLVTSSLTGDFTNQVISLQLFDVAQSGSELSVASSWCDRFIVDPDAPVHAVIPAAFVAALSDGAFEGTYEPDAEGVQHFQVPAWYQTEGVELEDASNPDLLPTEPDDPAVVDQDGDGQPGMTVELQGLVTGSTYVVQWSRITLDGVPVSADRIQGLLDFDARENVLASEPAYIRDQVEPSTPAPDACASFFVLVRVPADADCAEINEQRETLFPELLAQ